MKEFPIETASRDEIEQLQADRLQQAVKTAYENTEFYSNALRDRGLSPGDISTVDDITQLPFTTKEDLRDEYPDGLFAVDSEEIIRLHSSSGTTGTPKIVAYTQDDINVWSEVVARCLTASGITASDTVQNAYGYGLFTGGLGLHYGAEALGATVIPIGGGQTQRQIELLRDLESDVISCTPSYALYLAETAEEMGVDTASLPLRVVIFGAEPCTEPMREAIERRLGVSGIDIYGLSEIIGPGVSIECIEAQDGLHIWEDHFYPEIIDPDTGEQRPPGEEGELVLTTLSKDAMPILRYRTGDLTTLTYETCSCGRTMVRMDNVTGRTDDLLIVRGVNLYPSEIESVVLEFDAVAPYYRIDLYRDDTLDRIEITIEYADEFTGELSSLHDEIYTRLQNVLSFSPDELTIVEPGSIERTEVGKVKRVYDHR